MGHAERVKDRLIRAVRGAAVGVLVGGALTAASACGQNSGCVHTAIAVAPGRLVSETTPLTLRATLTSDGKPLPQFRLAFSLVATGPPSLVGKSGKMLNLLGYAFTDANGVALYRIPGGVTAVKLPGTQIVGYEAGLTTANPINDKYYCDVHSSAPLT